MHFKIARSYTTCRFSHIDFNLWHLGKNLAVIILTISCYLGYPKKPNWALIININNASSYDSQFLKKAGFCKNICISCSGVESTGNFSVVRPILRSFCNWGWKYIQLERKCETGWRKIDIFLAVGCIIKSIALLLNLRCVYDISNTGRGVMVFPRKHDSNEKGRWSLNIKPP